MYFEPPDEPIYRSFFQDPYTGLMQEFVHNSNLFLAQRFARKVRAETTWFEQLISHRVTIGTFYESILKNTMAEFSPSKYRLGTGFIYDVNRGKESRQIDILVYDDSTKAPLYRNGELVVLQPSLVRGIVEVKKTLDLSELRQVISNNLLFNLGTYPRSWPGVQYLNVFAFKRKATIKSIVSTVIQSIDSTLAKTRFEENGKVYSSSVEQIALPRLFFFDTNKYILTHLERVNPPLYRIRLEVLESASKEDSMGEFLFYSVPLQPEAITGAIEEEHNFLIHAFGTPEDVVYTEEKVALVTKTPIAEIAIHFPTEVEFLRSLREGDRQVYAVVHPKEAEYKNFRSAAAFISYPGTRLVGLPEHVQQNVDFVDAMERLYGHAFEGESLMEAMAKLEDEPNSKAAKKKTSRKNK